jgi:elongation factor P
MLEYNEVKERRYIVLDGEPYEVLTSHVFRKQQRKPVNATKLKNLFTGKVLEHSFAQSDKVPEADITESELTYLYNNRGEYWFCHKNDKSKRLQLPASMVADKIKFMKSNDDVKLMSFDDRPIGIKIPIKVSLKVTEAAPAVKGNTAQGGAKRIKLETGAELEVPMFVNEGDVISINTDTGEYVERV